MIACVYIVAYWLIAGHAAPWSLLVAYLLGEFTQFCKLAYRIEKLKSKRGGK